MWPQQLTGSPDSTDETYDLRPRRRCLPRAPLPLTDHKRNGTTSLFAALDVATVEVIGRLKRQHRSTESSLFRERSVCQCLPICRFI